MKYVWMMSNMRSFFIESSEIFHYILATKSLSDMIFLQECVRVWRSREDMNLYLDIIKWRIFSLIHLEIHITNKSEFTNTIRWTKSTKKILHAKRNLPLVENEVYKVCIPLVYIYIMAKETILYSLVMRRNLQFLF